MGGLPGAPPLYSLRLTQKGPDLLQEARPGWLVFEDEMVSPLEGDERGSRDTGGHSPSFLEGYGGVAPAVHHQRRHSDLGQK